MCGFFAGECNESEGRNVDLQLDSIELRRTVLVEDQLGSFGKCTKDISEGIYGKKNYVLFQVLHLLARAVRYYGGGGLKYCDG